MVDMTARMATGGLSDAGVASASRATLRALDARALADYRTICAGRAMAPAQNPVWIEAWLGATGADGVLITLAAGGETVLALPLEVVRHGPFRIARYMGGNHANGNFPVDPAARARLLSSDDLAAIRRAVRAARPDIDLLALARHNPWMGGHENPLRPLATATSPNVSLAVDLSEGFERLLDRRNGKRKRKKFRLQQRKLEELGYPRLIQPKTAAEVERVLDAFFVLKARRFAKAGIPDVFAPPQVRDFFRRLFVASLEEASPPFRLDAMEAGGSLRAINGQSVTAASIVCEFGAICDDVPNASPGFYLDFVNIQQAAGEGKSAYDFSVGDEEYKRSWCELETWQFDCFWPVSAKGVALNAALGARAGLIRFVKSHEGIWSLAKRARARLGGDPQP